jgi:hypothetical protein
VSSFLSFSNNLAIYICLSFLRFLVLHNSYLIIIFYTLLLQLTNVTPSEHHFVLRRSSADHRTLDHYKKLLLTLTHRQENPFPLNSRRFYVNQNKISFRNHRLQPLYPANPTNARLEDHLHLIMAHRLQLHSDFLPS